MALGNLRKEITTPWIARETQTLIILIFSLKKGEYRGDGYTPTIYKDTFSYVLHVCGGGPQGRHYLLHIGVELKLALQGAASHTSYKSPWDLESAHFDAVGFEWDFRTGMSHKSW